MEKDFHSNLFYFVSNNDNSNANKVVVVELAKLLLERREDYVEVLNSSDVKASVLDSNEKLISDFVDNACDNKKLLLGMSFLINHSNRAVSFDGEEEISDAGVKDAYKTMYEYFGNETPGEDYENAGGVIGAIAGAVGQGAQLGGKIVDNQRAKKFGASDSLAKQREAKSQMIQAILDKQKQEEASKAKTKRTVIIAASILGALLIGFTIYYVVKKKK